MTESIFAHPNRHALEPEASQIPLLDKLEKQHHRHLVAAVVTGILLGVLAFATIDQALGARPVEALSDVLSGVGVANEVTTEQFQKDFPTRELPAQWQWEPRPLDVDHMYMRGASPRPDWIRRDDTG